MTTVAGLEALLALEIGSFKSSAAEAARVMQQTMGNMEKEVSKTRLTLEALTAGVSGFARGLAGAAIGAVGITTLTQAIGVAVREFSEAEQAQVKFAAVLRATGNAAGVSASDIADFANQMEQTRVVTAATVTEAATRLATFENITDTVFTRAIEVAQDLSVVLGEDLVSSTARVGKALQDPIEGLNALERAGIKFSTEQRLLIDQFLEMGQIAEAQGVILEELASRVGGAGAAKADSLEGAFHSATTAAGNFLAELLKASGGASALETMARAAAAGLNELTASMKGQAQAVSKGEQQLKLKQELIEAEERLARIQENAAGISSALVDAAVEQQQGIINNLRTSIQDIENEITRAAEFARRAELNIKQFQAQQIVEPPKDTGLQARLGEIWKGMNDAAKDAALEADRAATAAANEAEQRAKSLTILQQQAEDATKLAEVVGKGAYAEELIRIELEKQNKLRAVALEYSGEQLRLATRAIEKESAAARRAAAIETPVPTTATPTHRQAELASMKELAEQQLSIDQEALRRRGQETKEFAKTQYDILIRPWEDLASDVNRIMAGVFEQILFDAGSMDFSAIADGIGDTFARAISGSLANIIMTPVTRVFTKLATEGVASITAAMRAQSTQGYMGAAGLGGAGGFVLGSAYSQMAGLRPGNQAALGGGLGGAGGAALGLWLSGGNPLGALAGGALGSIGGSLFGGLFGGQNNLGNDRSGQVFNLRRGLTYSDRSFSQENRQITQGIIDELSTLKEALEGIGAEFERLNLTIAAGNKTGITVNGKTYATAQDALRGSIEAMLGGTTGLTGIQAQILQTTKAGTAQGVLADVQFGKTYEDLTFQGREVDRVLATLAQTFAAAGRKAAQLGLDVGALAAAHQREAAAVVEEFQARQGALRSQLQAAGGTAGAGIPGQFHQLNLQFQELAKSAIALGVPLQEVTDAHQRAAVQLTQTIQTQQRGLATQLRATAPTGTDAIAVQFDALQLQFEDLARAAAALDIPLQMVTEAHQRAANVLATDVATQVNDVWVQMQQIGNQQQSDPAVAIFQLNVALAKLAAEARKFGIPEAAISDTIRLAQGSLAFQREQQARQMNEALAALAGDQSLVTKLHGLETQFREIARSAAGLHISLAHVNAQKAIAIQRLRDEDALMRESFRTEVASISPVGSTLTIALAELDQRMADLRRRARELGESIGSVDAAAARARAELIARQQREAATFQREIEAMAPTGSALQRELGAINDRFFELRERAQDLGVAITTVNAAQVRAQEAARAQFAQQQVDFLREVENIAPTGDTLALTLREIENRFVDLRKRAVEMEVPLTRVTDAQARAIAEARRQYEKQRTEFRRELEGVSPTGDALTRGLKELEIRFGDLRQRALELGVAVSEVDAAATRARAELEKQIAHEQSVFLREIEEMAPTGSALVRELNAINDRFFELRERAKDLGVAITQLDAAQVRARDQARARFAQEQIDLKQELEGIAPSGSALALQLKEIDLRFASLRERATELEVPLRMVDEAYQRAKDEANRQFTERRQELLLQVQNLGAVGLTKTLHDIQDEFRNLRKELDAVGLATVDLTLKQREAEQRAIAEAERQAASLEQQAAEQQRSIRDFFEGLIAPLRAANQNVLAPIAQIEAARRRFAETSALARGGDLEAIRDLAAVTADLMGLRERYLSSGGLGADILAQVQAGTQGIISGLEQQQREAMASVPDVIRETTSEHIRVIIAENEKTIAELQALRREIAQNRLKAA